MERIHDSEFAETSIPEYCVDSLLGMKINSLKVYYLLCGATTFFTMCFHRYEHALSIGCILSLFHIVNTASNCISMLSVFWIYFIVLENLLRHFNMFDGNAM